MATADLRLTFGAMFVGCLISVAFSGIGTLQAYLYFRQSRRRDTQSMKLTVSAVWILDLIHSVFICQSVWHYLVLSWGDLDELDHLTWTVAASIAVTGLITFVVQTFFANRVWRLSKHNAIITALIVVVAVVRLGSALTTTYQMIRLKHFSLFIQKFRWLFTFGLALSCIIDALITSSLCYYLQGSRTGYSSIDDIIHRLLLYTINNGLLTSFASMLAMIFAAAMPHNFLFLSLHFFIAKCYINSLLASLNSRDALKDRDDSHPMAVHISMDSPTSQPRFFRHQVGRGHSMSVSKDNSAASGGVPVATLSSIDVGQTTTVDSLKVHINVEQTIHCDEDEVENDMSPDGSVKGRYLGSHNEKEKDTLDIA